jgi:hypothetical protein
VAYRTIRMPDEPIDYKGKNGWGRMGLATVTLDPAHPRRAWLAFSSTRSNGDTAPCQIAGPVRHVRALLVALLEEVDLAIADDAFRLPRPPHRYLEVPDGEPA